MQGAAANFSDFINSRLNSPNCSPEKCKETIKDILREWDQKRLFDLQTSLKQKFAFCKLFLFGLKFSEENLKKLYFSFDWNEYCGIKQYSWWKSE